MKRSQKQIEERSKEAAEGSEVVARGDGGAATAEEFKEKYLKKAQGDRETGAEDQND